MRSPPRIYHPGALSVGQSARLDGAAFNRCVRVLRLRVGAPLTLFNGDGSDYTGRLFETSREHAEIELDHCLPRDNESPLPIHLQLGISRADHMDLAIRKAVELGVTRISPMLCQHGNLPARRQLDKLHQHWFAIVISACEQCGRARLPQLDEATPYAEALHKARGRPLLLDHRGEFGLKQLEAPIAGEGFTLFSGPEGGFSEEERKQAQEQGIRTLRLGPRVLRTETAPLAAISALQCLFGDLGGGN